jgi:hypothetical protein
MNNGRFLKLLNSGKQEDFNILYDELLQYAGLKAKGLPIDAAIEAVSKIYDLIIEGEHIDSWPHAKTIIDNALVDLRRKQGRGQEVASFEVNPLQIKHFVDIYSGNFDEKTGDYTVKENAAWGWQGFTIPDSHGYPSLKFRMEGKEREICRLYWQQGMEQHEIARKLNIDKGYVSRTIKKHKASPKPDTRDSFTSGIYPANEP